MVLYRGLGLDNVYLQNGYTMHRLPSGEEGITIHDLDGLHAAVAIELATRSDEMDGPTFRFLRKFADMGQRRLAGFLGLTEQTVSLWERGKGDVSGAASELLRAVVRELITGDGALKDAINRINRLDRKESEKERNKLAFEETDAGWQLAA